MLTVMQKGSLFGLLLRLYHVMLDIILIICLVVVVTQHTTACCSMQVIDITLAEQASTNITSLRMVQQKHCGPKYKLIHILLQTKA
jgi:predicted nucleic acid binding AN1-type Zn finger protein